MKALILLLLVLPTALFAQKCKYSVYQKDTVSGKEMIVTKPAEIFKDTRQSRYLYIKGMKSDNGYFFEIKFINSTKFQIPRQYPMVITLNDGSTITLKTMDDKGKTVTERPANFSASALYGINVIDLKKLKEQGAKSINLSTREGKVDLPLKKKQGQLLAGLAGCIQ